MKEKFREINYQKKSLILLENIKEILQEYETKNIKVTLRQLYYQLVSRDIILNNLNSYQKISSLLTNARYTGSIDWVAIEDRTRIPNLPNTFENIKDLLNIAKMSYQLDRWKGQDFYMELWTEKDAISSVISPITRKYQVPVSVNRGYNSVSSMYEAAQRFLQQDRKSIILYLGDHDASGLDMDRDIQTRLNEFGADVDIIRIGLTMEQIKKYNPPENFLKKKDPRGKWYLEKYGTKTWEVDALQPEMLQKLIESSILKYLDLEKYNSIIEKEEMDREELENE